MRSKACKARYAEWLHEEQKKAADAAPQPVPDVIAAHPESAGSGGARHSADLPEVPWIATEFAKWKGTQLDW